MRYKGIELINYGGIYNGMGLYQIKIDFTKCISNKIIIRGANGSGKSTLINAINPNPDSNDCFIPNMEARKNIYLEDENTGIEYIIRYIHPVTNSGRGTTKGYISKTINGQMVELNPNGNISSCKDILYEEFNLDANFISLSRLSSEDRGLVDNKPAERKKLLNSIINTLDVYNDIYKKLSKKSASFKQLISTLSYKIDSLGNKEQLNSRLVNTENRLIVFEEEKETTIGAIAAVKLKISEYMDILKNNNYDSIVTELKDLGTSNLALRNLITRKVQELGITSIDNIEQFYSYISSQITTLENEIELIKQQSSMLLSQREVDFTELQNKRIKLNSLQSDHNYFDLKNSINQVKTIIEEYNNVFNQMGLMNINLVTKTDFDIAMESLKTIKDMATNLLSLYDFSIINFVFCNRTKIFNDVKDIQNLKIKLDSMTQYKVELEKQAAIFESKQELIAQLSNRPNECKIDNCPYIKTALDAFNAYPPEEYTKLLSDINELNVSIEELSNRINLYEEYTKILASFDSIEVELSNKYKYISKLPLRQDFKETFISRVANMDPFNDIDELYKFVDCGNMIEEYKAAKEQLSRYDIEYKIYEAKNDIIESIAKDVETLSKKTDDLQDQITTNASKLEDIKQKIADLSAVRSKIEALVNRITYDLLPSEARENELLKIKESLDVNSNKINKLHDELSTLNINLSQVNNDIKNLSEERDSIKHSLLLLDEYKTELDEYNSKYIKIEKIKYYSSPSTGIQTLFMQLYMNKIISIANDLLSLLFSGEFVLQPFIINENEFRIPCCGSGLLHNDISSMSTAQKCMISMILSFSILNQSSSKYNVMVLDEIDAGLDTMNRGFFIDLLDRLMSMLNSKQCFIISHNNELNTSACDLILLKNNSNESFQGNVIWHY